jgi:hypothetical protein
MFPDNNWYGHRKILLKYLDIKDQNLFASLQHGWQSQFSETNYVRRKYPTLFWSKHNIKPYEFPMLALASKKDNNEYSIGSPFLYLCEILKIRNNKKKNTPPPKGTLIFPAHSSQDLKQETDHNLLIKKIEEKFDGPYTVCFYYYDLNLKDIAIYKKKKWRVVFFSRGGADKYSLYRQYIEMNKHSTVVCGEFCSALFYSMYLKKKTKILFDSNLRFTSYFESEKKFVELYKKNYPQLFDDFLPAEEGYELGKKELGFECIKDREELKNILGCNSFMKNLFSKIFSFIYDLKYGSGIRKGENLSKNELQKYKNAAATIYK